MPLYYTVIVGKTIHDCVALMGYMVVVVVNTDIIVAIMLGVIFAIIAAIGIVVYTEPASMEYTYVDVEFDGPIFAPAQGTETFVFGAGEMGQFTPVRTGIFEMLEITVYGTLYTSDTGYWVIVDPIGQVPMSGNPGSTVPMGVTE